MACNSSDLIQYSGISTSLPSNPQTFTQFTNLKELCVPTEKPDIGRILTVDVNITLGGTKVINTPVATSLEGQILTGHKYIVNGFINVLMMYVSDTPEQTVHSAHFEVPFCQYIVLPVGFVKGTPITVVPYIEGIKACTIDNRCFSLCTTILLEALFCASLCQKNDSGGCSYIKVINLAKTLPQNPVYFKEFVIQENLTLPDEKPDIEDIISVAVDVEIVSLRIVNTRVGTSLEGQNLSGCKLIVELRLNENMVYVADEVTQPVYSATFPSIMRSSFIIVPCTIDGTDISVLLSRGSLKVTPYIEAVCTTMTSSREVFKCVTLLLDLTIGCN